MRRADEPPKKSYRRGEEEESSRLDRRITHRASGVCHTSKGAFVTPQKRQLRDPGLVISLKFNKACAATQWSNMSVASTSRLLFFFSS